MLAASLARDRTPTQISGMSEFGLVEITRKRMRDPLVKLMTECCRTCHGRGRNAHARKRGAGHHPAGGAQRRPRRPARPIIVRAAPEVVRWLNGARRRSAHRPGPPRRRRAWPFEPRDEFDREGFDVGTG